jgi:hypothetical protein
MGGFTLLSMEVISDEDMGDPNREHCAVITNDLAHV